MQLQQPNRMLLLDYTMAKPGSKAIAQHVETNLKGFHPYCFLKRRRIFTLASAAGVYFGGLGGKKPKFDPYDFASAQRDFVKKQPAIAEALMLNIDARESPDTQHTLLAVFADTFTRAANSYFCICSRMGSMLPFWNSTTKVEKLYKTNPLMLTGLPAISVRIFYPKAQTPHQEHCNNKRLWKLSLGITDAVLQSFGIRPEGFSQLNGREKNSILQLASNSNN